MHQNDLATDASKRAGPWCAAAVMRPIVSERTTPVHNVQREPVR